MQRRQRVTLEAHETVWIVLEDEQIALGGQLDESAPPVGAEGLAGRVLEGRDGVEERRRPASFQLGLQRVHLDAVLGQRNPDDLGAE